MPGIGYTKVAVFTGYKRPLAETLAIEYDIPLPPVTAAEVEAAYLRRMKAKWAKLGPPQARELPVSAEASRERSDPDAATSL